MQLLHEASCCGQFGFEQEGEDNDTCEQETYYSAASDTFEDPEEAALIISESAGLGEKRCEIFASEAESADGVTGIFSTI